MFAVRLPLELARLGHEPTLIMPAYRQVFQAGLPIEPVGPPLEIRVGQKTVSGRLLRSFLPAGSSTGGKSPAVRCPSTSSSNRNISTAIISTAPGCKIIATTANGSSFSPGPCST